MKLRAPVLLAVGLEGFWGLALACVALPVLEFVRGPDGRPLDSFTEAISVSWRRGEGRGQAGGRRGRRRQTGYLHAGCGAAGVGPRCETSRHGWQQMQLAPWCWPSALSTGPNRSPPWFYHSKCGATGRCNGPPPPSLFPSPSSTSLVSGGSTYLSLGCRFGWAWVQLLVPPLGWALVQQRVWYDGGTRFQHAAVDACPGTHQLNKGATLHVQAPPGPACPHTTHPEPCPHTTHPAPCPRRRSVTKNLSGAARATIDACRTLFIWLFALSRGWERFHFMQARWRGAA